MSVVFLSYDRESATLAEALAKDVQALGNSVWFDQELAGGQLWWDKILGTIRGCDVFVAVRTPRSLASTACRSEHGYAAALGKTILPVLPAEGVSTNLLPPALALLQFVDCRSRDREAAFRLARAFATLLPSPPLPDPLPDPPEVPGSYLGSLAQLLATSSTLTYEQQSALLVDLKESLRDSESAQDARTLLTQMRKRRDLMALIAKEIDDLMGAPVPMLSPYPPDELYLASSSAAHTDTSDSSPRTGVDVPSIRERLVVMRAGAIVGIVVGALLAILNDTIGGRSPTPAKDVVLEAGVVGFWGAIAGFIAGKRWKVILAALVVAVVTSLIFVYFSFRKDSDVIMDAGLSGAPLAILGSLAAIVYLKSLRYLKSRRRL